MNSGAPTFRSRVVEMRLVPGRELRPDPRNWKVHPEVQRAAYRALRDSIGFAGCVIARQAEDGGLYAVDGHMRQQENPEELFPTAITDLTFEEAALVLLTYDPLAALAVAQPDGLGALLEAVRAPNAEVEAFLGELAKSHGLGFGSNLLDPPTDFVDFSGDLATEYRCPSCGYAWSGDPKPPTTAGGASP